MHPSQQSDVVSRTNYITPEVSLQLILDLNCYESDRTSATIPSPGGPRAFKF